MSSTPLLVPTLVLVAVVAGCWTAKRVVSLIAAACSVVLLGASFAFPGWPAQLIVEFGPDPVAAAVSIARVVGAACFLYSVVLFIRLRQIPW